MSELSPGSIINIDEATGSAERVVGEEYGTLVVECVQLVQVQSELGASAVQGVRIEDGAA